MKPDADRMYGMILAPLAPLIFVTCAALAGTPASAPQVGKPAPDLALKDTEGKEVRLSAVRGEGKHVLLVFLPGKLAAKTEASGLLERLAGDRKDLERRGVQVLCVSPALPPAGKRTRESLRLPYPVLSDPQGKAAGLYKLPSSGGRGRRPEAVSVFLMDREGILRCVDEDHRDEAKDREALDKALAALPGKRTAPAITGVEFGSITVNGKAHTEDIVIDGGEVRERDKGPSKKDKDKYGHTPLTPREKIPWGCKRLIIGTGMYGSLPVTDELKEEAKKRGVELILLKTPDAVKRFLEDSGGEVNAIFHITC
jgi:peroxiredoxin